MRAGEESREGLSSPLHELSMLMEGWLWQALGERVSDVLCTCALDKLDLAVSNHVPQP